MNNYPLLRVSTEVAGLYLTTHAAITITRAKMRYNRIPSYRTTLLRCMRKRVFNPETIFISGAITAVGYTIYKTLTL